MVRGMRLSLNSTLAMDALHFNGGIHGILTPPVAAAGNGDLRFGGNPSVSPAQPGNSPWGFTFRRPLRSLWPGDKKKCESGIAADDAVLAEEREGIGDSGEKTLNGNWIFKILHVRSLWKVEGNGGRLLEDSGDEGNGGEENGECKMCVIDGCDHDEKIDFDRESFSKLLRKVPLDEARLYGRMSYLGSLAYSIPEIKPGNLLRYHGLRFVTSSVEKKEKALKVEKAKGSAEEAKREAYMSDEGCNERSQFDGGEEKPTGSRISASAAYQIAASAASYLHSGTRSILQFKSSKLMLNDNLPEEIGERTGNHDVINQDVVSLMATTDSVAAVVAAKEEIKRAVADDLNSPHSSPCEWFICDDDQSATRIFVIQGSGSLASWQANLLFEPIQFEGLDVLVHRGIYESAKGIYKQMLPEVYAHLKSHGDCATFRFTGHSLGGSLSLLVNLMLLIRGEAPQSSLLPVITFGAPSIMCGGDRLLCKLGLPRNHVLSITLHRDIVPRAFSCNYPTRVAKFLKAINGNFRSLPCLNEQKLLYTPMGEFLILQPDDKFSPSHDLLPSGSGLYLLTCNETVVAKAEKQIQAAQAIFLNSPHPLEILSDRSAYGSGGTVIRDHDMNSYLKSIRHVIRQELSRIRKATREQRRRVWWQLVPPQYGVRASAIFSRPAVSASVMGQGLLNLSGIGKTGREPWRRFSQLIASRHVHLLFVVLLFPARLMILGTSSLI